MPFFRYLNVKILQGNLKGCKWGLNASTFECLRGDYEPETQNVFLKYINKNNIVYDIGANVGYFTLLASNKQITFTDSENTSANTYIHSSSMIKLSPTTQVQARSLDDLIYNNKLLPPNFIKIDIEGAEFDALKGAEKLIKKYQPIIYISTHENHLKGVEESCKNFLSNLNYDVTLLSINNITTGIKDYIAKPKYEKA